MTATPIPRTLGQVLYADLDVSDLRTPPEGRIPIRTGIRQPDELAVTWERVRRRPRAGHRTFVVVPADRRGRGGRRRRRPAPTIFDSSAPAAEAEAVRLRELLAPLRVGMVHGRMKAADRDAEMARFRDGELDVLVGTTVVEVGVDVPEATMMVIEGADRFGLAQLHQLRGRVGRGTAESRSACSSRTRPTRRPRPGSRRSPRSATASSSRRRTSSCAARATCSGSSRAACRGCGSRRSRTATTSRSRSAPASHAEALLDAGGRLCPDGGAARCASSERGWLARVWAGEPASGA